MASSPRNHDADADPSLSRKRPRYSGENLDGPNDDMNPLVYEVIPIESTDEDNGAVTEIVTLDGDDDDDLESIMSLYSDAFNVFPKHPSIEQVAHINKRIAEGARIHHAWMKKLADFLVDHVELSATHDDKFAFDLYMQDENFFGELAGLCHAILLRGDEFVDPSTVSDRAALFATMKDFTAGVLALSARIVRVLPAVTKEKLSRRDSTQGPIRPNSQYIPFLAYIVLFALILSGDYNCAAYLSRSAGLKRSEITYASRQYVADHPDLLAPLVGTLDIITRHAREVKDSWLVIGAVLHIMIISAEKAGGELEVLLEIIKTSLLPLVCEKHPRALPDLFHDRLVQAACAALESRFAQVPQPLLGDFYERFVKGDVDAVLPEGVPEEQTLHALLRAAQHSPTTLSRILSLAWTMQTLKMYITSSIMDVRSIGTSLLVKKLMDTYNSATSEERPESPVVQYAARFLRANELARYIFSADSHAGLIGQSVDIIGYLGATSTYTNRETDIIWNACTTSVEAEFVKMSFHVLQNVCRFLGPENLLYLAQLYRETPAQKISPAAVEFLPELFGSIRRRVDDPAHTHRLATASLSLDLLGSLHTQDDSPPAASLATTAKTELGVYASYDTDARLQILRRCTPHISQRTPQASTSVEIICLFLKEEYEEQEVAQLLALVPVDDMVSELCHYIETVSKAGRPYPESRMMAVTTRLEVLVRLLSFTPGPRDKNQRDLLFSFLFGSLALDNPTRDAAWQKLESMFEGAVTEAATLQDYYLNNFAVSLSPEFATPHFLHILFQPLRGRMNADLLQDGPPQTLHHPLWKTLVGIALASPDPSTVNRAVHYICDLLFTLPENSPKDKIVPIQKLFLEQLLDRLCERSGDADDLCRDEDSKLVLRGIDLLSAILTKSQALRAACSVTEDYGLIQLHDQRHTLSFNVLVWSPENRRVLIKVLANELSTLSQLESALSAYTGTSRSKIIFRGSLVHPRLGSQTEIQELGVQQGHCLLVAPTYTASSDLDKIWTSSTVVHQTLSAGFDRLAKLVDGPKLVAQQAYRLLQILRPSMSARQEVRPPKATPDQLFSKDRPFRTMLSLSLLRCHFKELRNLAVLDEDFMSATVQLLVAFMLEEQSFSDPFILVEVLACLQMFVRERVVVETARAYFTQPSALVDKLVSWMIVVKDDSAIPQYPRARLIQETYDTLLQAGRRDPGLWQTATQNQSLQRLHAELWLDHDAALSRNIATSVLIFCTDRSDSIEGTKYYWPILADSVQKALETPAHCTSFFELAIQLLPEAGLEESNIRGLIDSCCRHLWVYKHTETPEDATADRALLGLLSLIRQAIVLLQGNKLSLGLHDVGVKIFAELLLPPLHTPGLPSILCDESRGVAYAIVKATCETRNDLARLLSTATHATHSLCGDVTQKYNGRENWLRQPGACVGLSNLGMTCYMNSLLQQLFSNVPFRQFMFDTPVVDPSKQNLLRHVQDLFASMQGSNETAVDTTALARALNIETDSQEDVHGFYAIFISRLEDNMPDQDSKKKLSSFFAGTFVSQVKGECGHVSTRVDPFHDISITVKNKTSLYESLDEFVQGEPMQGSNKYKCLTCAPDGKLVDAMKRTSLETVPDNLTFCLKRFTWETATGFDDKINDRFEFADKIDMAVYKQASLDDPSTPVPPDMFELVGVIVHQGSLQFGHYWSYVRFGSFQFPGSIKWMYLEDRSAKFVEGGLREVQEQCFGGTRYANGQERSDNAYVLIYRRSSVTDEIEVQQRCQRSGLMDGQLPEVQLPADFGGRLIINNAWRCRISQLFHQHFSAFVAWALNLACAQTNGIDAIDAGTHGAAVQLAVTHLLRITLNDGPSWEQSLNQTLPALQAAVSTNLALTEDFLQCITQDYVAFNNIWRHFNRAAVGRMARLLETCLRLLREQGSTKYDECLDGVLKAHAFHFGPGLATIHSNWASYFELLVNIANLGSNETCDVLEMFPLETLHRLTSMPFVKGKERDWSGIQELARTRKLDTIPISDFMAGVLAKHVDLDLSVSMYSPSGARTIGRSGVTLTPSEVGVLTDTLEPKSGLPVHEWLYYQLRHSKPKEDDWMAFGPGKLFGLLVGPRVQDDHYKIELLQSLVNFFDVEDQVIARIIHMSLHYCLARGDDADTTTLVSRLAGVLTEWDSYEVPLVRFMEETLRYAPVAVYQCINEWAPTLLECKSAEAREKTCEFLYHHLLGAPQTGVAPVDTSHVDALLMLISKMSRVVGAACDRRQPRDKFQHIVKLLGQSASVLAAEVDRQSTGVATGSSSDTEQDDNEGTSSPIAQRARACAPLLDDVGKLFVKINDWRLNSPNTPPNDEQGAEHDVEDEDELGSEDEDYLTDEEEEMEL